jgi:aminoglycoside phosphotransferase (APT) family kinase protein
MVELEPGAAEPEVPRDASESEYLDAVHRPGPWRTATLAVCRREGLVPRGDLEHLSVDSTNAVMGVPPDHIVKFYGHWRRGFAKLEREVATLRRLDRDASLPVPRLVAHGSLNDAWGYLVMTTVPGIRLCDVDVWLDHGELRRIASWLGDVARRLYAIPLTADEAEAGSVLFRAVVEERLATLVERPNLVATLPRHLLEQLDDWMPTGEELLGSDGRVVTLHGALRPEHVLGHYQAGRFFPTGVIDLNSSLIGDPLYELGYVWWCALKGDRDLLDVFLAAADIPGIADEDFPRRALAWALVNACWDPPRLWHLENVSSLDELAERAFGHRHG